MADPATDPASLENEFLAAIENASTLAELEEVRLAALGKKGRVSELLKSLGGMTAEERQVQGPLINGLKLTLSQALDNRKSSLETEALNARLAGETEDVTLPVQPTGLSEGRLHPVSQVTEEIVTIFADLGFSVAEGPDVETDFHNFTALNIPESHPARQMHDTFYFEENEEGERLLLRTHTSPVQIRTMEAGDPPFRFIAPGRTYRCDSDQTHTPMFHQVEGLVIDKDTHLGHLKWVLETFLSTFFEVDGVVLRLRPSYFPFTEPSMEVDVQCARAGNEIRIGEGSDWMEILGCGMVHPNVLTNVGIDPEVYQGFAFGMGIDRLAMLKYGMSDLRAFFDADLRWLRHYGFSALNMPALQRGLSVDEGV